MTDQATDIYSVDVWRPVELAADAAAKDYPDVWATVSGGLRSGS